MRNLSNISKFRSELMGAGLIWVMLYHFYGKVDLADYSNVLFSLGHAGVDIFLFCSGLGLYMGYWNKNIKLIDFYKKRFIRIFPSYWLIIVISSFLKGDSFGTILWKISSISFWIGKPAYDWYVPSILVIYIIFPLFLFTIQKKGFWSSVLIYLLGGVILTALLVFIGKGTIILFTSRIPVFYVGCIFGRLISDNKPITNVFLVSCIVLCIFIFVAECWLSLNFNAVFLRQTALHHIPFCLIIPGLCILLSYLFFYLSTIKYLSYINFFFSKIGKCSLEIYLVHMSLRFSPSFVYITLAIILGIVIHNILWYITETRNNIEK